MSYLGEGRFRFLNETLHVAADDFAARKGSLLWDYNFHYFDGLLAPSPERDEQSKWIATWLSGVPAGSRPGWDPYPVSRRILSWTKWVRSTRGALPPGMVDSLAWQVRYLERDLEYHLLGNHLLANAAALTAAGIFFGGAEGDGWLSRGTELLVRELDEQFLADGAHYELSPVYHAVILEDLLDLLQLAGAAGLRIPVEVRDTAAAACGWLRAIVRPDGKVPLFNDASYGVASDTDALLAYARQASISIPPAPRRPLSVLEPSGYFRYEDGELFVVGDVGDIAPAYQPGHAHCDMLSFSLSHRERPVLVDAGTSTYAEGARRTWERGTAAHNTVQVAGLEQSEMWAAFRVARRARMVELEHDEASVRGMLVGFPPYRARHQRTWLFDAGSVRIRDELPGRGPEAQGIARLHFHPDVELSGEGASWSAGELSFRFEGHRSVSPGTYEYAPEFNLRREAPVLEIPFEGVLETVIRA